MLNLFKNRREGVIAFTMVLAVAIIIVSLAIGLGAVSYNELASSSSASSSATALSHAISGAQDALEKITKDKNYFIDNLETVHTTSDSYTINYSGTNPAVACPSIGVSQECARISVDSRVALIDGLNLPLPPQIITVTGQSGAHIRKIQVDSVFDYINSMSADTFVEIKNLPTVSTAQATGVTSGDATLNGWTNPNSVSAHVWFRYSATAPTAGCVDTWGTSVGVSSSPFSGSTPSFFSSAELSGLTTKTTYYYCAIAGTDASTPVSYGNVFAFTTD